MRRLSVRGVGLCALFTLPVAGSSPVSKPSVPVAVHFQLTAADGTPLAGAPVRLVLGTGPGWQGAQAGGRFVADSRGEIRFPANLALETRRRKLPTNFTTQLLSSAQETQHLTAAVELPYLGRPWLYVAAVDRFANGTSAQLDGLRVFGRDPQGGFTVAARMQDGAWLLPGVDAPLRPPGHEVTRFVLEPAGSGQSWKVILAFVRHPEPVRH